MSDARRLDESDVAVLRALIRGEGRWNIDTRDRLTYELADLALKAYEMEGGMVECEEWDADYAAWSRKVEDVYRRAAKAVAT